MADNLGPNGLVVSAGKCAGPIPAENCANAQKMPSGHKQSHYMGMLYFPHEVRFSAGIGPAHFPAGGTAIDACAAAIFTSLFQCLLLSRFCLQLD